tara:strand:+ start:99 stop:416 length:318 start_codon:yes stop_codon:yes gene_type:complete
MQQKESSNFPNCFYDISRDLIEVFKTGCLHNPEKVDENLTLLRKSDLEGNSTEEIIGFEITNFFDLLSQCFEPELVEKIREIITEHVNAKRLREAKVFYERYRKP